MDLKTELQILRGVYLHKPAGLHKHMNMISLSTSLNVPPNEIWEYLSGLYHLEKADALCPKTVDRETDFYELMVREFGPELQSRQLRSDESDASSSDEEQVKAEEGQKEVKHESDDDNKLEDDEEDGDEEEEEDVQPRRSSRIARKVTPPKTTKKKAAAKPPPAKRAAKRQEPEPSDHEEAAAETQPGPRTRARAPQVKKEPARKRRRR